MGSKNYKVNDFFSLKIFDTEQEKKAYEEGFKNFCESVKSKLEGKGPEIFFKQVQKSSSITRDPTDMKNILAIFADRKELSLDKKISAIRDSFYQQYSPKPANEVAYKPTPWIKEIYPDYAIVNVNEKLYKVTYGNDADGKIVFADKSKWVEMQIQLIEVKGFQDVIYEHTKAIGFAKNGHNKKDNPTLFRTKGE